ncbi:type I-E CRISPR-associated protein Cas6/Cse3/CasE [Marinobacterium arenosum]|uniref:type I-E CRISPR-associated protein Cas6/Cse3/CasE n=1 Tax=Marinobacterium arenosum TaxID=2862496 RepID=UPI001C957744|nr:type I-E CRISPR-associated protein Cas6/Cse3/CasE [Marinobacterium arenosum]MBY4678204.1 type I-E CRISPR-associated protein Cas6/Cse3/CasE [Marinobacterium arenosum]
MSELSYLSRITLKPQIADSSHLALLIAGNGYGMHRLLWDLFPGRDGQRRDFLFREEREDRQGGDRRRPMFYLLSPEPPSQDSPLFRVESTQYQPQLRAGDRLTFKLRANPVVSRRQPGRKNSVNHDVVMDSQHQLLCQLCRAAGLPDSGDKGDKLARLGQLDGDRLRHLLPTELADQAELSGGGMLPLQQLLRRQVDQALFDWLELRAERNGFQLAGNALEATGYEWRPLPEKGRNAGFSSVDYQGALTVTDPERFTRMLHQGLGKARAFGCGLMLVRRL